VLRPARLTVLHALGSRDFRLLWSGQTISLIGNGAFFVAIGWRVTQLTGHASSLALVLLAESLAMLTTLLIGGALADRYERRRQMIASDLVRCGVVATLAAVDASGHLTLGILLALAVGVGLGDGFFHPAFGGIVPQTVEADLLPSANALIGISRNMSFVVGPALAAVLYDVTGSATLFALDAASFLFSAGLLALARPRMTVAEVYESTWRGIVDGARYVASVPWLWVAIATASVVLMVGMAPFQSLLPRYVESHFGRGVGAYGLLFTAQAIGMLIGTLAFGQLAPRRHRIVQIYGFFALNDLFTLCLVLSPWYELALVLIVLRGWCIGFGIASWETLLMEFVPESKLSRVISLDFFGSLGLTPVGYALTAVVAGFVPPQTIMLTGFTLAFLLWTAPLLPRRIRTAA
jgi:MFS family permease